MVILGLFEFDIRTKFAFIKFFESGYAYNQSGSTSLDFCFSFVTLYEKITIFHNLCCDNCSKLLI